MRERAITAFAPGRVNLIGEHTDYNAGLALAFAIAQGVTVTLTPTATTAIDVHTHDLDEHDAFTPGEISPAPGWRAYVRGMVAELWGDTPGGAQITISGDLPQGAGLASSAALNVALGLALCELQGAPRPDELSLARVCQRVEHDWAGAQTGLLDPLTSLAAREGEALLIDFQELTVTPTPLRLDGHSLVLVDTGERHAHAASAYNERRAQCHEAANRMRLETLRDATIIDLHMLPDELEPRARHVISENGRVLSAVDALAERNFERLGRLLNQSHASLRDDFEVSTPALDAAAERLLAAGALGARMVGGGFGGNVIALMAPQRPLPHGARYLSPCAGARLIA